MTRDVFFRELELRFQHRELFVRAIRVMRSQGVDRGEIAALLRVVAQELDAES
jgi:hypothetical protein